VESLQYATTSVLNDFHADGVRYLELRTTPREIPERGISKEEYVLTVLESIDRFKKRQEDDKMAIYLILSIDRGNHTAAQAMEIVDLAIKYKSQGTCVVGIDLCGNPTRGDVSIYRAAFAKAKDHSLKITLHFGETPFSGTVSELSTLLSFQPDRLGHVIHVPDPIREEIARRRLGLELCMSCNVHAKMIDGDFADHHFGYYYQGGDCPIALCVCGV
jgi:adenosine deaminase